MLFSYNWLKEFTDVDLAPPELAEALTMAGIEVESVSGPKDAVKGVVAAEVLSVEKHPNADRLVLCEVRTDSATYPIVCGAKNMKKGDMVALALPGTVLPGGVKIKKSKIRGEVSHGMMCSEVELGIADTSDGIMILDGDTPVGVDVAERLAPADTLLDVAILPNRADILSTRGLAREISAVTGAPFKVKGKDKDKDATKPDEGGGGKLDVPVTVSAPELCRRYTAALVKGIKVGPSPDWMRERLEALGIRSINNVVDATNYVMLDVGQPLHAFDFARLEGASLDIRTARKGEKIVTIDGVSRELDEGTLVICDSKGPVAVAGIMGGDASSVHDGTETILLESAWFDPASVRSTSRKLALSSDSSYRFERGVDIESVMSSLDYAARLIAEVSGGTVAPGAVDVYTEKYSPVEVRFRLARASLVLGIELEAKRVIDIFTSLGMEAKGPDKDGLIRVVPPPERADIKCEEDLIEEAARLIGYDTVPITLPLSGSAPSAPSPEYRAKKMIREHLQGAGFVEVVNYSFVSEESFALSGGKNGVRLLNPLSEEQVVMRGSLVPSLLKNLEWNLARKNEDIRIFELGPAFESREGSLPALPPLPNETWKVSGLMSGQRHLASWNNPAGTLDFFDLKGVVEALFEGVRVPEGAIGFDSVVSNPMLHPGKSASVTLGGAPVGTLGELHPDLVERLELKLPAFIFELDLAPLVEGASGAVLYGAFAKFPESARDIAFVLDEAIPYSDITRSISDLGIKVIENVMLFDVYYGENIPAGKRSLGLRLIYRSQDKTLKYEEVEKIHSRVSETIQSRFKAEIRKG